jgi:hypothetical protein
MFVLALGIILIALNTLINQFGMRIKKYPEEFRGIFYEKYFFLEDIADT